MLLDLGFEFGLEVVTDASAAKAIASRLGLGKTRHIAVHFLFGSNNVLRMGISPSANVGAVKIQPVCLPNIQTEPQWKRVCLFLDSKCAKVAQHWPQPLQLMHNVMLYFESGQRRISVQ